MNAIAIVPPLPLRLISTGVPSEMRSCSSAARVCTSFFGGGGCLVGAALVADLFLDERFGLAHREAARHDVARKTALIALGGSADNRARVAHRERAGGDVAAHFFGEFQQPQVVGDRRAILADLRGDVVLLQMKFVGEPLIGGRGFHRVEILALDVLDQRHLEQPLAVAGGDVLDDDRDPGELRRCCAARQRRSPAMI